MIEKHIERVLDIGLGVFDVVSILIGLHPDEPEKSLNVLLFKFIVLHPPTNHRNKLVVQCIKTTIGHLIYHLHDRLIFEGFKGLPARQF